MTVLPIIFECTETMALNVYQCPQKEDFYSIVDDDVVTALVTTVEKNNSNITVREYSGAKKSLALSNILNGPYTKDLRTMLTKNCSQIALL